MATASGITGGPVGDRSVAAAREANRRRGQGLAQTREDTDALPDKMATLAGGSVWQDKFGHEATLGNGPRGLEKLGGKAQICSLTIPGAEGGGTFYLRVLPQIGDGKTANYTSQTVFGRSNPIRSYGESGPRTISVSWTIFNTDKETTEENFNLVRALQAAVHPKYTGGKNAYEPPPLCQFTCGIMLSGDAGQSEPMNVLITSYKFGYGNDCLYNDHMLPFKIDVSVEMEVAYSQRILPGFDDVLKGKF